MRSTSQTPSLSFVIGEKKEAKKWLKSTFLEIQIERIIRLRKIKKFLNSPLNLAHGQSINIQFSWDSNRFCLRSEFALRQTKLFWKSIFFTINNYKYIPMTIDP